MADTLDPRHEALVEHLFRRTAMLLGFPTYTLEPLRRRKRGAGKFNSYRLGYTRLDSSLITVDLYTPRTTKPRKIDAILRVIAHELAHHKEPPRRAMAFFGKWQHHHPIFWKTYKSFVALMEKDDLLGQYFDGKSDGKKENER